MAIREMVNQFHRLITEAIRNKEIELTGADIKQVASSTSGALTSKLGDANLSPEERKKAANALVAISTVEEELTGY